MSGYKSSLPFFKFFLIFTPRKLQEISVQLIVQENQKSHPGNHPRGDHPSISSRRTSLSRFTSRRRPSWMKPSWQPDSSVAAHLRKLPTFMLLFIQITGNPPEEPHLLALLLVITDDLGCCDAHLNTVDHKLPGSLQRLTGEVLQEAGSRGWWRVRGKVKRSRSRQWNLLHIHKPQTTTVGGVEN